MATATDLVTLNRPLRAHVLQASRPEVESIALADLLWRRKLQIAAVAIAMVVLAMLVLAAITPQYTATAVIQLDVDRPQILQGQNGNAADRADPGAAATQVRVLASRNLIADLVDRLQLMSDPEFNTALEPESNWTDTPRRWLESVTGWQLSSGQETVPDVRQNVVSEVLQRVEVAQQGQSSTIAISFTSESRAKASRIANGIGQEYLNWQKADQVDGGKNTLDSFDATLSTLRTNMIAANRAAAEGRRAGTDIQGKDGTLLAEEASRLSTQLLDSQSEVANAEARLQAARRLQAADSIDFSTWSPALLGDAGERSLVAELYSKVSELERQRSELSVQLGSMHPRLVSLEAEIERLRSQISREIDGVAGTLSQSLAIARQNQTAVEQKLAVLRDQARAADRRGVEIGALEAEADTSRTMYESFLSRAQELGGSASLFQPNARFLSEAPVPAVPSFPKKTLTIALAAILGLFAGVLLAVFQEGTDQGLRSAEDVLKQTAEQPLALVPRLSLRESRRCPPDDYPAEYPNSAMAEGIRSLLFAVDRAHETGGLGRSVLVTSALSGEGKTNTAICLARAAARAGASTLLIDADFLRPSLQRRLELESGPGFGEVIAGTATLLEALQMDSRSDVKVLTAGSAPPEDVLPQVTKERLGKILSVLVRRFEFVVIDSAPVMVSTAIRLIAGATTDTVVVVRWGRTPRKHVMECIRQLKESGARLAGVAISMVNVRAQKRYRYGDAGAYARDLRQYYR